MTKTKLISSVLTDNETTEIEEINYFEKCLITKKTKLPPTQPSVLIDGTWVCTKGEIMMVSGQKKAGKSNVLVFALATALMKEVDTSKTLGIRSIFAENEVIFIDTEQSESQTQEFIFKVCDIAGYEKEIQPTNLLFANIRSLDMKERSKSLVDCFKKCPKASLIVIDGITDFIDSVNNEEESKKIIDAIMKQLANGTSIILTIHEGKDANGARGHIGQEIERKCVGAVSVSKDRKSGIHKITCKMIRKGRDFDDILFKWDDDLGGFSRLDELQIRALQEKSEETKQAEIQALFQQIFAVNTYLKKPEVMTGILNYDLSINKTAQIESQKKQAKRKLDKALEMQIIVESDGNYSLNN